MDYAANVMAGFKAISRDVDTAVFTGWSSGRFETFSRCCAAPTYVQPGDYYAGIPSCSKCNRVLGPDGMRREWVPPRKMDPNTTMECPWPMEPPGAE